jgi:hypothetical protein
MRDAHLRSDAANGCNEAMQRILGKRMTEK